MVKAIIVALVIAASGCLEPATETVIVDSGFGQLDRNPCYYYFVVIDRYRDRALPYIGPGSVDFVIYVDSPNFMPIEGAAYPQEDGTTQVWRVQEMYYEDGSFDIGSAGHVDGDTAGWCQWLPAVRSEDRTDL